MRVLEVLQLHAREAEQLCVAEAQGLRGREACRLHMSNKKEQKEESHLQVTSDPHYAGTGEAELSAKLQTLSVKPRTGGLFEDHVVNTRQNMEHVKTSKIGSEGQKVTLLANHFRVTSQPQWNAYVYTMNFQPEVEDTALRTALLLQNKSKLGSYFLLDGNSLILPRQLQNLREEITGLNDDDKEVDITLQFSKKLRPSHPDCIRYFNILFRRVLRLMNLKQIGRNYYNNKEAREFHEHNMEIWPGYITSILQYENSLTLCADVSHKLIRMETAYDIIARIYENNQYGDWKKSVEEELIGSIVITKYNNRTYRIDDINWHKYPKNTFKRADGSVVTFVDYYMERYRECITDLNQPLLSSQGKWKKGQQDIPRDPILLVPELCYLTGLTDPMRKNSRIMRDLASYTRLDPQRRQEKLRKFMNAVQNDKTVQNELQLWDLQFDSNFLTFKGRVMNEVKVHQPRGWKSVFELTSPSHHHQSNPQFCLFRNLMQEIITDEFETYITRLKKLDLNQKQMVVCVLPNDKKDRYDDIKKYLCIDCPIPSQCVVARTLEKPQTLMTIVAKIVQQINCKLGGALWTVEISMQRTMFVGIDCFHDIAHRHKSIAGFVASTNQELTRWYSECVIQEAGQELVSGLGDCLKGAIAVWLENIPSVPMNVIVYRDGVGDGQLQALLDHEIPQLVNCLESNFPVRINLTFIVVKKRINTRFFLEQQGGLRNPSPGTVIDVELTKHEWYDFFIVSQSVTDGTVTPTHYNVIYDTVRLKPDEVQRLTYQLCHMYYNLPGIIRVPAPCHYAHKLAYLVGQSIHQKPHISLSKFLYYI
ncbi:piwi-like protein 3 [Lepus europaeus]|uniref:piwi-like protein 3 n=1 Tax=Lepus europaeus TaxID=9983 RepID=UPI002B47EEDC|nr:piwi-like protein 3 [Lepus europaeus]